MHATYNVIHCSRQSSVGGSLGVSGRSRIGRPLALSQRCCPRTRTDGGERNAREIAGLSEGGRTVAVAGEGRYGARGRSRTDTLLKAADFLPASAFAAPSPIWAQVRGPEHAFTIAAQAVGARRLLSTPSRALWRGLGSA